MVTKIERWNDVLNMELPDMVPVWPYAYALAGIAGYRLPEITTKTKGDPEKFAKCALLPLEKYDYDVTFGSYFDLYLGTVELGGDIEIPEEMGQTVQPKKYPVEDPSDWEKVQKKLPLDPKRDGRIAAVVKAYEIVAEKVGKTTPILPCWWVGPTASMVLLRKPSDLTLDMVINPDFAQEIIKAGNDFAVDLVSAEYEAGANSLAFWSDVYGTEMISTEHHREFVLPYAKEYSDHVMKNFGQKIFFHFHGPLNLPDTYPLVEEYFNKVNIGAIQWDEKHDLEWIKKEVVDKYRVPTTSLIYAPEVLSDGPVEDVVEESKKPIDVFGRNPGLIAGPTCDLPADIPEEYFKAWVDTTHEYGRYR